MKSSELCYLCSEKPYISYKFKKIRNKESARKSSSEEPTHCHRMCPECLIRYIFIKYITLFEKPSKEYMFICPCGKGNITLTYEQIIDLFQNKTVSNLQKKEEKKCSSHGKIFTKFCKDCKEDVCDLCLNESTEKHYEHRIEDKKVLYDKLKNFFNSINLKNHTFQKFMENFNYICAKFREILEKNYNDILISLDKIINSLIDFRAKYSVHYKEKVINNVQTLKLLKMFYSNYYYDIHKAENVSDFKIYKYLNQINYELEEVNLIFNKINAVEKLKEIKECSDYLNKNINDILDINYCFRKVPNGYRKYQSIQKCDDKNLKTIKKIDEYKILTNGESYYMNYLEDYNGEFSVVNKIPVKDKITAILLIKGGSLLTSFGKKSHYNIQEWKINENFSNVRGEKLEKEKEKESKESSLLNSSFNLNDIDDGFINRSQTIDLSLSLSKSSVTQNLLNNNLYERATSFDSTHKDDITVMIEMSDSKFATAGNDKRIVIWEREIDKHNNTKYKIFQTITKENEKISLYNPIKHLIFLYNKNLVSSDEKTIFIWSVNPSKIENANGFYSLKQKINSTNGDITCICQVREGYLIYCIKNTHIEILNEIDGKYQLMQSIKGGSGIINCISQLKDNRIIIGTEKGIIKIFELKPDQETQKVEYQLSEYIKSIIGLPINCMEVFDDGSFIVGQKTTLHIWKNNESI
jgi:hypothetical protein